MTSALVQQLQIILQLLQCTRRERTSAATRQADANCKGKARNTRKCSDGDDISTDDASDQSMTLSPGGETDSDDNSNIVKDTQLEPMVSTSTPVVPPPGLELPTKGTHPWSCNRSQVTHSTEATRYNDIAALKEALDRLNPAEIATVKSLLDSKVCDDGLVGNFRPSSSFPIQSNQCSSLSDRVRSHLEAKATRRPFKPFQGVSRAKHSDPKILETMNEMESSGDSLKTYLRDLSLVDNARVLQLRKINRLGLNSPKLLENYLSSFGNVERLMVSHMLNQKKGSGSQKRVRPAVVGFAVMSNVADAQAALRKGAVHTPLGDNDEAVEIHILPFQSHDVDDTI